jgi:hypothetical protein
MNQAEGLQLRDGKVKGGHLFLHETPEGQMNIKQVVDKFAKRNKEPKENPFALNIDKIALEDFDLIIERREHRDPEYGIDYNDMHINRLTGQVEGFSLVGSHVEGQVSSLSFEEHTGFKVEDFTAHFEVGKGSLSFNDVLVRTADSHMVLPSLTLQANDWSEYKDFIRNVRINGRVVSSDVSTDDIAHFAPKLLPWQLQAKNAASADSIPLLFQKHTVYF